jgi:hypothetical protein
MKPERIAAAQAQGVIVLEFGVPMPDGAILLADSRPKHFKGCRTADDPAATAIYVGGTFERCKSFHRFENFDRALKKALKLAKATT